jgi:hypothetical protein
MRVCLEEDNATTMPNIGDALKKGSERAKKGAGDEFRQFLTINLTIGVS